MTLSVLEKATRLQGEARRLDAGAKDEAEALRVSTRIEEVRASLGKLRRQIETARDLKQQAPAADVRLTGLDDGRANLAAKGSVPSDQAFVAARKKIDDTASRISQEVQEAWNSWTSEQVGSLPVSRIPMLDPERQEEARSVHEELRRSTRSSSLNPALFVARRERLRKLLEHAQEAPERLLALLSRLPLLLRDLTDEDIALLRKHGLDCEIEVRRQGA